MAGEVERSAAGLHRAAAFGECVEGLLKSGGVVGATIALAPKSRTEMTAGSAANDWQAADSKVRTEKCTVEMTHGAIPA